MTNKVIDFKGINEAAELKSIIEQLCKEAYNLEVYPKESANEEVLVGEIDNVVYGWYWFDGNCTPFSIEADSAGNFTVVYPDGNTNGVNIEDFQAPLQPLNYEVFYQQLFTVVTQ